MNTQENAYKALDVDSLPDRLGSLKVMVEQVGQPATWTTKEVGDGNLNLVFIVEGEKGAVIVKQALPYVRLVGDSWPLPLKRSFFEYNALIRQAEYAPGTVPNIHHFDEEQALIVMEFLSPHIILRHSLMEQNRHETLPDVMGKFCARTLFKGSDLSLATARKKADVALFSDNVELCDITENLVFTDPYFDAEMNRHTTPHLDAVVAELRNDHALKAEVQQLKWQFCSNAETLLHGDLHTGSIMVAGEDIKVIDPEFAFYGPMGFDVGMLLSNYLMSYYSQEAHVTDEAARRSYQDWILSVVEETWTCFEREFARLWRTERAGIAYPSTVFEDQGHDLASELALTTRLGAIFADAMGFCGVELHRRILGLAHNADFETIEDEALRARCEAKALHLGRQLIVNRHRISGIGSATDLARHLNARKTS